MENQRLFQSNKGKESLGALAKQRILFIKDIKREF